MKLRDPFVLAVIAAICGSSVPIAGKIGLETIPPLTLNFLRFLSATLFIAPFVMKTGDFKRITFKNSMVVGVIGALNPLLFIVALQYTQASVTPLIYAVVPAMTSLYSLLVNGLKPTRKQIVGMFLGFLGVAIIVLLPLFQKGELSLMMLGNVLIFLAAIAFMFYGIVSKKQQKDYSISPITLTFIFCLASLVISLPFAIYEILGKENHILLKPENLLAAVYMGSIGTGVFYITYQYALQRGSAVAASLFLYLQPIVTLLMSSAFLGEKITFPVILGGVLAIAGAKLASAK